MSCEARKEVWVGSPSKLQEGSILPTCQSSMSFLPSRYVRGEQLMNICGVSSRKLASEFVGVFLSTNCWKLWREIKDHCMSSWSDGSLCGSILILDSLATRIKYLTKKFFIHMMQLYNSFLWWLALRHGTCHLDAFSAYLPGVSQGFLTLLILSFTSAPWMNCQHLSEISLSELELGREVPVCFFFFFSVSQLNLTV